MLRALQPCWVACGSSWVRSASIAAAEAIQGSVLSIHGSRGLATTATAASAASPAAWHRRFEGIAPGSVLSIDLPDSPAHVSLRVGEHEAIELSSSAAELKAEHAPHDGHPGSSVGANPEMTPMPVWPARKLCLT